MKRRWFCLFWITGFCTGFAVPDFSQTSRSDMDSTFWFLSLPELQSYKVYYLQELERLQEETAHLIQKGIEDGERLLQMRPDSKVIDQILVRLADLYCYKEKDEYLTRMQSYEDQLAQSQDTSSGLLKEPRLNYSRPLEIYQRIIDEFPQSELVDDAIYNKGFLFEEMGQKENAMQVYLHLIDAYPQSIYVPEAYMRLAEHYFNPPVNDLPQAISYYEKVLGYRDSPRYDEALYKLGWSYYRLSQYPEAISYFTTLIEDIQIDEKYDPLQMHARADLGDEAIEYVAISFVDFGGSAKMQEYFNRIGNPGWGEKAMEKLGDIYMQEKEEYTNAIYAYETLLRFSPGSPKAPLVQQKIVECYRILKEDSKAFDVRQRLFEEYKAEGTWWRETTDEKAKLNAYRLAEESLRENINAILKKAEELASDSLYEKAVELGRTYLESFPEDDYAYMVRWNVALILDTKLQYYKEALQEYLTISMVYNEEKYKKFARDKGLATIRDAAENAIVVADSLVQRENRSSEKSAEPQGVAGKKESVPLTTAESWLAMAYDNYIKLFPFDKSTPTILSNTGALYYTHNQFNEALKYFKTLVKYFPQSKQIQNVQYAILESYFGKQDFQSAEILAKRIRGAGVSDEMKKNVEKRLGEAIFLKAQSLADAGQASQAADEFYRMALEVPSIEFADRALFNAGREYERIGNFRSAIRAYELLRVSYSGSSLVVDAMNNLAFDYAEIGEFQKAAERYETLNTLLRDGEKAKNALYNAYVFYGRAKNWTKAIEIGKTYAFRYPEAEDASAIYFKTGEYYLNLNDLDSASQIYSDYANRFPDSPLGVEAYFRLGKYYLDRNILDKAEYSFQQAFAKSESLKNRGLDENGFYAAEGLFFATQLLHNRMKEIAFTLPQEVLDRAVEQKQSLVQRLVDQYAKVGSYGTHRLPESVYRIGEVYEDFAQAWAHQGIPTLDPIARAVKEKEINERTTQIYDRALGAYLKAVQVFEKVSQETPASASGEGTSSSSDTLVSLTAVWQEKAKEKVSETLYQMAEINTQSIDRLLAVPIPADLNEMARLEYRSQVLTKAIKPLVDVVVKAHQRNVQVADSLHLQNKWTEASRSKILSSLNILAQQFEQLSFDALTGYQRVVQFYRETVLQKGQDAPENVLTSMVNFIDLSKSYSLSVVAFTKDAVQKARASGFLPSETVSIHDPMVHYVLVLADSLGRLIFIGSEDQKEMEKRFQETGDVLYEDVLAAFEDNVFFLNENLKLILETTYETEKQAEVPSPQAEWLGIRLVMLDPNTYSEKLNIPVKEMAVQTDTTWWYSTTHQTGWETVEFIMKGWKYPQARSGLGVSWDADGVLHIAAENPQGNGNALYFRKGIFVPGYPFWGEIRFSADSPTQLFLNGLPVSKAGDVQSYSLTSHMKQGRNVLALEYMGERNFSVRTTVVIRYVPDSVLPKVGGI